MPKTSPTMPDPARRSLAACVLALALGALASASPAVALASVGPVVSPAPGTPAASPGTQISLLGVDPSHIRSVRVVGATSGVHAGRLKDYSGRRGASFLLATPLTQGETVRVAASIRGRPLLRWSFTVARTGTVPPVLNLPITQPDKLQSFVTRPDLQAPKITVNRGGSAGGDAMFLTPLPSPIIQPGATNTLTIKPVGPGGPMIIDGQGRLVWFKALKAPDVASNLAIQRYRGKRVLTWWEGPVTTQAYGLGHAIIADSSYRTIATVKAGNGYQMDIHELRLDGPDALFTIYTPVLAHLPGTPAGTLTSVLDSVIQQVDVRTGLVVWEWQALGHIPMSETYATPEKSASNDLFHINSIQPVANDGLVVSARNTSTIYEIDRTTGKIRWQLGGKKSDFKLGRGARFWFQHDALLLKGDRISMFDDEAGPPQKAPTSRGLVLQLDRKRRTATVLRQYTRPADTSAQSEGSTQTLANGNVFVGFGAAGPFSEFTANGKLVFDAQLPEGDGSYRVYRHPWSASPRTRPTVRALRGDDGKVAVYASWNGATKVARWQVIGGSSTLATAPRTGFETKITLTGSPTAVAVRALDAGGRTLSTSAAVPVS